MPGFKNEITWDFPPTCSNLPRADEPSAWFSGVKCLVHGCPPWCWNWKSSSLNGPTAPPRSPTSVRCPQASSWTLCRAFWGWGPKADSAPFPSCPGPWTRLGEARSYSKETRMLKFQKHLLHEPIYFSVDLGTTKVQPSVNLAILIRPVTKILYHNLESNPASWATEFSTSTPHVPDVLCKAPSEFVKRLLSNN